MGFVDHFGSHAGSRSDEHFCRRFDVEPADERREPSRIQVVHGRTWGSQLDGMAAIGGQMEVSPCHDVLVVVRRQSTKAESPQDSAETDFNTDDYAPVVGVARDYDVGDSRKTLPRNVDDLGVQDVATQQDLAVTKRIVDRVDCKSADVDIDLQLYAVVLETLDCRPRHQQVQCLATPHEHPRDEVRTFLLVEHYGQVDDSTDVAPAGSQHTLAGQATEQVDLGSTRYRRHPWCQTGAQIAPFTGTHDIGNDDDKTTYARSQVM